MASHSANAGELGSHIKALPPEIQYTILDFTLKLQGQLVVQKYESRGYTSPKIGKHTHDNMNPPASGAMVTASGEPFTEIDPLTMSAIIQAQLQDGQEIASRGKGKQREGTMTDDQVAMQIYMEDLQSCNTELEDRKMAQSMALAVQQDGDFLHDMFEKERQIAQDREMALRLAGRTQAANVTSSSKPDSASKSQKVNSPDPWQDPELLAKAAAIYMGCSQGSSPCPPPEPTPECGPDDCAAAESSAWAASRKGTETPKKGKCIACGDEKAFFDVARVLCNHEYCRPCLKTLFSLSMKDESLFPPRCDGQEIPLRLVRFFLPSKLARAFEDKYEELSTKNRTYCHDRACGSFVPPASARSDVATCTKCGKATCTMCKQATHTGDCPQDEALQQLLATSKTQQWQRCPTCKAIVELHRGCNHITCRCGANFCYVCAAKWRTCECPVWDERRLLDRAVQIAPRVANPNPLLNARQPNPPPRVEPAHVQPARVEPARIEPESRAHLPPRSVTTNVVAPPAIPVQNNRIAEAVEHLRANHECDHAKWRSRGGIHQCEECQDVLRRYIYECQQCYMHACNRCRRNRL